MGKNEHPVSAKIYQFQPRLSRDQAANRSAEKALQARRDAHHVVDYTACYHSAAIEEERAGKA